MHVCTYIYIVKLEDAIQSHNFKDEKQKAGLHILFTAYQLKCIVSSTLKPFDVTAEQYNVLRILKGKHPENMCVKDIAERMIERSSNVPRIIDRLVAKNLVKRTQSKEDKRETVIALTDKGLDLLESSSFKMNDAFEGILQLNNEEAKALNDLLEKVNKE
jgi:DNA-binding MarR family transcriptional regulator